MRPQDLQNLKQNFDKKGLSPIYFLIAEDAYLTSSILDLIRDKALEGAVEDLNYDQFSLGGCDINKVRDTVETLPMMAPRRLVVLKEVEKINENQAEALLPIVKTPVDSTVFVLVAEKIDKRKKFFKELNQTAHIFELKRPYENQVPEWIDYMMQKLGKKMGAGEKNLILDLVGFHLMDIHNELKKLVQYIGDRTTVTSEDILQVISPVRMDTVFDLALSIGNNDQTQALTHLANLLDQGQNEVGALALVARHLRILSVLKEGQAQGLSQPQLAAKVGIPNFFLKQYLDQSRIWSREKLTQAFEALLETDRALKSSPVSSHIWLENFILRTCAP